MYDRNKSISVALVGNYPPPYGGVPVHVMRLLKKLTYDNIEAIVYCQPLMQRKKPYHNIIPSKGPLWSGKYFQSWLHWWFIYYGWKCKKKIIHCHDGWSMSISMLLMLGLRKKIVMTFHDQMTDIKWKRSSWVTRLAGSILRKNNNIWWIAVSVTIKQQLSDIGVPSERIAVIPAYLPPDSSEVSRPLPPEINEFINNHCPILSSYGWRLYFDDSKIEIHGFDLCIEAIGSLVKIFPKIGLIIVLPQIIHENYYHELLDKIDKMKLNKNVMFYTKPLESAISLWAKSDLYVRATTTDGDALSIREAMSVGTPVVTSDASIRPEGVILFKTRSQEHLNSAIADTLMNIELYRSKLNNHTCAENNYENLISIYKRACNDK